MLTLKYEVLFHLFCFGLCFLFVPGETQVLGAFPLSGKIDFSEEYKRLLKESKSAPSKGYLKEVAFDAIKTSQAAIKTGDYSAATKIATLAVKIGKSSGNNHAYTLANRLKQRSVMLAREYRKVEKYHQNLQKDPNDSKSAFLYGKFVALKLNHWKEGLFWLAKGDDAEFRALAKKELSNSKNYGTLLEVANGWYQLGGKEKGLTKRELELHAYELYSRAWQHSIGADRTTINDKLSEMPLRYLNHMQEQDVIPGPWPFGKNGESGNGKGMFTVNHLEFPNGLGLHPPNNGFARVRYQLDGQYKTFVTGVALYDHTTEVRRSVTFSVMGDDRVLWKSPLIRFRGDVVFCKVSVKNIKRLEIRTESPGQAYGANAMWLDPHVLK
ncbi:NPCBM/NEW2 domain-containing protein [Gimesia aquarii]|uniref:NPCBM/NEW2 domain protein n=1 Tax=Gimesia aquarii TaxID=2527964 RepID=A0A517VTU8_9PLAN|nr:NPCBM/NEW2 domain-containing protein [Gimesia aquarii]QDT96425.1 NPCBM/NEW2 domain protein [Gimesia aquarii]